MVYKCFLGVFFIVSICCLLLCNCFTCYVLFIYVSEDVFILDVIFYGCKMAITFFSIMFLCNYIKS